MREPGRVPQASRGRLLHPPLPGLPEREFEEQPGPALTQPERVPLPGLPALAWQACFRPLPHLPPVGRKSWELAWLLPGPTYPLALLALFALGAHR